MLCEKMAVVGVGGCCLAVVWEDGCCVSKEVGWFDLNMVGKRRERLWVFAGAEVNFPAERGRKKRWRRRK